MVGERPVYTRRFVEPHLCHCSIHLLRITSRYSTSARSSFAFNVPRTGVDHSVYASEIVSSLRRDRNRSHASIHTGTHGSFDRLLLVSLSISLDRLLNERFGRPLRFQYHFYAPSGEECRQCNITRARTQPDNDFRTLSSVHVDWHTIERTHPHSLLNASRQFC